MSGLKNHWPQSRKTLQSEVMDPTEIDPIRYGVLWQRVQEMDKKIDKMERQLEQLVAMANQGKGGFWMGMTIASMAGGVLTWLASHWNK